MREQIHLPQLLSVVAIQLLGRCALTWHCCQPPASVPYVLSSSHRHHLCLVGILTPVLSSLAKALLTEGLWAGIHSWIC